MTSLATLDRLKVLRAGRAMLDITKTTLGTDVDRRQVTRLVNLAAASDERTLLVSADDFALLSNFWGLGIPTPGPTN